MNDSNFSWRNVLKPTPPLIFWIFQTIEAIVLTYNTSEIIQKAEPRTILILLGMQTLLAKLVLFFGKVKDEYEHQKVVTITSDDPDAEVTVTQEIKKADG